MQNDLRWLLRRGSPLPIPNREVKPDCADGTAVMWESMSPPSFRNPYHVFDKGFLLYVIFGKRNLKVCTSREGLKWIAHSHNAACGIGARTCNEKHDPDERKLNYETNFSIGGTPKKNNYSLKSMESEFTQ